LFRLAVFQRGKAPWLRERSQLDWQSIRLRPLYSLRRLLDYANTLEHVLELYWTAFQIPAASHDCMGPFICLYWIHNQVRRLRNLSIFFGFAKFGWSYVQVMYTRFFIGAWVWFLCVLRLNIVQVSLKRPSSRESTNFSSVYLSQVSNSQWSMGEYLSQFHSIP
jgi:hypothetical protein